MAAPVNRAWRRVWSWLQTPWATGLLLVLLLADAAWVSRRDIGPNIPAKLWNRLTRQGRKATRFFEATVVRQPSGAVTIIDGMRDSEGDLAELWRTRPGDALSFRMSFLGSSERGVWGVTAHTHDWVFQSWSNTTVQPTCNFTQDDIDEGKRLFADLLASYGMDRDRAVLAMKTGRAADAEAVWTGYLHNTASSAALLALAASLGWVPRVPAWLATTRQARRLNAGECPHCRYSIAGLREPVCPECGGSWIASAEDPPAAGPAQRATTDA